MDDPSQPLSFSMVADQPQYREYVRVSPGDPEPEVEIQSPLQKWTTKLGSQHTTFSPRAGTGSLSSPKMVEKT